MGFFAKINPRLLLVLLIIIKNFRLRRQEKVRQSMTRLMMPRREGGLLIVILVLCASDPCISSDPFIFYFKVWTSWFLIKTSQFVIITCPWISRLSKDFRTTGILDHLNLT